MYHEAPAAVARCSSAPKMLIACLLLPVVLFAIINKDV